jgi:hypothetical protein
MSSFITDTVGLGTFILAVPVSIGAYYQIKGYHRQDVARMKAEEAAERAAVAAEQQARTNEIVEQVKAQLTPTNGRTVAEVGESSLDTIGRLEGKLDAHINNTAVHVVEATVHMAGGGPDARGANARGAD